MTWVSERMMGWDGRELMRKSGTERAGTRRQHEMMIWSSAQSPFCHSTLLHLTP